MKAVKKPVDPPKINPSLASYLQRPKVVAAAKKRLDSEKAAKSRAAQDNSLTLEGRINKALGDPKNKAAELAQQYAQRGEGPIDNVRHTSAGMYTADAIANKLSPLPVGPTTIVPKIAGFLGSNLAGLAHEAKAFVPSLEGDYRNIPAAARMTTEDMVNNFVGSALSVNPFMTQKQKEALISKLSNENKLPDGYEQIRAEEPKNLYVKKVKVKKK